LRVAAYSRVGKSESASPLLGQTRGARDVPSYPAIQLHDESDRVLFGQCLVERWPGLSVYAVRQAASSPEFLGEMRSERCQPVSAVRERQSARSQPLCVTSGSAQRKEGSRTGALLRGKGGVYGFWLGFVLSHADTAPHLEEPGKKENAIAARLRHVCDDLARNLW